MRFTDVLSPGCVLPELGSEDKAGVLREMARVLSVSTGFPAQRLEALLLERERLCTTAVGDGVAIPHCRVERLKRTVACVAVSREGVDFGAKDGGRVHLFVTLVSPLQAASTHLGMLARVAALMQSPSLRRAVGEAGSAEHIRALLVQAEDAYLAQQPSRHEPAHAASP